MKVDVYWNLHKKMWSVRHKGLVISHSKTVFVSNVKFVVQPAGNAKVRKTRRKNVHAFIRGELESELMVENMKKVRYNPYEHTSFIRTATKIPIYESSGVLLTSEGVCFAN